MKRNQLAELASAAILTLSAGTALADRIVIGGSSDITLDFNSVVAATGTQTITGGSLVGDTATGLLSFSFDLFVNSSLIGDQASLTGTSVLDLGASTLITTLHTCSDANGKICSGIFSAGTPDNGVDTLSINFDGIDTFSYISTDHNNGTTTTIDGTIQLAPVPLPAAAWLFGSALIGLAGIRRHRA